MNVSPTRFHVRTGCVFLLAMLLSEVAQAAESSVRDDVLDTWVLACAAGVLFMQAGFMCLESGMSRAKNSVNVAVKNLADFVTAFLLYWLVGFGLMYGDSWSGFLGTSLFGADISNESDLPAFFLFQSVFCGTAVTICSGAIAERTRFFGYLALSLVSSALIYPVFGHWAWGGLYSGTSVGWLEEMGFIDFAGSTVVHGTGAWIALAALFVVGPRRDKYGEGGEPMRLPPHNLVFVYLGTFVLAFGWLGFNCGSDLSLEHNPTGIAVNTLVAGCCGAVSAALLSAIVNRGRLEPEMGSNGMLGGLVAITAGCAFVSAGGAACLGIVAGILVVTATLFLERTIHLDDVCGAVAVHGVCGAWGTIGLTFFIRPALRPEGFTLLHQLGVQLFGVIAAFGWAFGTSFVALLLINRFIRLRCSPDEEDQGLNVTEHGATSSLLDLRNAMNLATEDGAYSEQMKVVPEYGTESGDLAFSFNCMVDAIMEDRQQLEACNRDLKRIMETVEQGIFSIDREGVVGAECSSAMDRWFGESCRERRLSDFIGQFDESAGARLGFGLEQVFEELLPIEVTVSLLPQRFVARNDVYSVDYDPVYEDEALTGLAVSIREITDLIRSEELQEKERELLRIINALSEDRTGYTQFLNEAGKLVIALRSATTMGISEYRRQLHTLKGIARIYGLTRLAGAAHDLETVIRDRDTLPTQKERGPLCEAWDTLARQLDRILGIVDDGIVIPREEYEHVVRSALQACSDEQLAIRMAAWGLEDTGVVLQRLSGRAEALAKKLGKAPITVQIEGTGLLLEASHWSAFWSSVVHLLNNAIDHGFEDSASRREVGKPTQGTLKMQTQITDDNFVFSVSDDGGGINWDKVRRKAEAHGLPRQSLGDLADALFSDGISTRDEVSESSGRGVGMASVRAQCERLGGYIDVQSRWGVGTTVQCVFPLRAMAPKAIRMLAEYEVTNCERVLRKNPQ